MRQTVCVAFVVRDESTERLEELLVVASVNATLASVDAIVIDFALAHDAERVVAGEVSRVAYEEGAVGLIAQESFCSLACDMSMVPNLQ